MSWQRANVQAATNYLRERIAAGADDARSKAVYEGLLDVLDPARRIARVQRESAADAKSAVTVQAARERRNQASRERRRASTGPPSNTERRAGRDRRGNR
jgi:hypothetical protein